MKTLDIYVKTSKAATFFKRYIKDILKSEAKGNDRLQHLWKDEITGNYYLVLSRGIDCFIFNLSFWSDVTLDELGTIKIKEVSKEGKYIIINYEFFGDKENNSYCDQLIKKFMDEKNGYVNIKEYSIQYDICVEDSYLDINMNLVRKGHVTGFHLIDVLKLATFGPYPQKIKVYFPSMFKQPLFIDFPDGFLYITLTREYSLNEYK